MKSCCKTDDPASKKRDTFSLFLFGAREILSVFIPIEFIGRNLSQKDRDSLVNFDPANDLRTSSEQTLIPQ